MTTTAFLLTLDHQGPLSELLASHLQNECLRFQGVTACKAVPADSLPVRDLMPREAVGTEG